LPTEEYIDGQFSRNMGEILIRDLPCIKSRRKEKTVAACAKRSGPSTGDDSSSDM